MADNQFRSSRNRDPLQFSGEEADDPLAELARMIGQGEPNANVSGSRQPRAEQQDWAYNGHYPDQSEMAENDSEEGYGDHAAEQFADAYSPHQTVPPGTDAGYGRQNLARDDARYGVTPRYQEDYDSVPDAGRQLPAFLPRPQDDHYTYDDAGDDRFEQSYDGEDYDEAPNARRRGGFVVVAAVLALAVLGTAGAFAYRAMFGGSMLTTLPPIIKADNGPNKILPNAAPQGGHTNDRAGAGNSFGEKLVSREEKPVDVPAAVSTAPRVVATIPIFPAPDAPQPGGFPAISPGGVAAPVATQAASVPTQAVPAMPPPAAAPPPVAAIPVAPAEVSTEPKKIRTLAIRPDQADGVEAAPTAPPPAPPAPQVARPAPPRPQVAAVSKLSSAPAAGANAPLSIVPSQTEPAASGPVHPRTALAQPTLLAPPVNAASAVSTGGYAVQVSSQRSEAEAHAAFRTLQAKFPAQLGGREPLVRRADLGAKGVYYRALVGPFASMEQAAGLCSSLKAAGGNCIVQRD